MPLTATYGMRPGENLAVQAGQFALQSRQHQSDQQFAADQAGQNRSLQERMQKRQLKQQAVLGGIQAGVGIASALVGGVGAIPGIVEGFRNLAGPTGRQIQQQQFSDEMDLRQDQLQFSKDNLGFQAMNQGAQVGVELAKLAQMKQQRQSLLESAEQSYGTDMMLDEIPQTFNNSTIEDALAGDPMAMQRARERSLLVTTPAQSTALANLQQRREQIANNATGQYNEYQQQFALAEIDAQIQAIQSRPQVNRSRMPTENEVARSQVQMIPVRGEGGEMIDIPMVRQSRGNYGVMTEHPMMVKQAAKAKAMGEAEAEDWAVKNAPNSTLALKASEAKQSKGGTRPLFTSDGMIDTSAISTQDWIKMQDQIIESKKAAYEIQSKATNGISGATLPPPDLTITQNDITNYLRNLQASVTSVNRMGQDNMRMKIGQTLLPPGTMPAGTAVPIAQAGPAGALVASANPLRAPVAPGHQPGQSPNPLRQVSNSSMSQADFMSGYEKSAFSVPQRQGVRRVTMTAANGNLPELMGMDYLVMEHDGSSLLPVLPDRESVLRYARIVPPGSRFITASSQVAKINEPAKK